MIMCNKEDIRKQGIQSITEVKFENTINRLTAVANPRQIERAIRGSKFPPDIIYEVEQENEILEDIKTLAEGFKLIQYDYIGGNGSRGYGKIEFKDLEAEVVIGELHDELLVQCNEILKKSVSK